MEILTFIYTSFLSVIIVGEMTLSRWTFNHETHEIHETFYCVFLLKPKTQDLRSKQSFHISRSDTVETKLKTVS